MHFLAFFAFSGFSHPQTLAQVSAINATLIGGTVFPQARYR